MQLLRQACLCLLNATLTSIRVFHLLQNPLQPEMSIEAVVALHHALHGTTITAPTFNPTFVYHLIFIKHLLLHLSACVCAFTGPEALGTAAWQAAMLAVRTFDAALDAAAAAAFAALPSEVAWCDASLVHTMNRLSACFCVSDALMYSFVWSSWSSKARMLTLWHAAPVSVAPVDGALVYRQMATPLIADHLTRSLRREGHTKTEFSQLVGINNCASRVSVLDIVLLLRLVVGLLLLVHLIACSPPFAAQPTCRRW